MRNQFFMLLFLCSSYSVFGGPGFEGYPYQKHKEHGLFLEKNYVHISTGFDLDVLGKYQGLNINITPFPDRIKTPIIFALFYSFNSDIEKSNLVKSQNVGLSIYLNNIIPYYDLLRYSYPSLYFWGSLFSPNFNFSAEITETIKPRIDIFWDFFIIKVYYGKSIDNELRSTNYFGFYIDMPVSLFFEKNARSFVESQFDHYESFDRNNAASIDIK